MKAAADKLAAGDMTAKSVLVSNTLVYVKLLREHIDQENGVLFPMADNMLSESEQVKLHDAFEQIEANAICERFLGSVRRECLDHSLVLGELHLYRLIREYVAHFNRARPHQGIEQQIPEGNTSAPEKRRKAKIIAFPILNRLHHDYRLAA